MEALSGERQTDIKEIFLKHKKTKKREGKHLLKISPLVRQISHLTKVDKAEIVRRRCLEEKP